MFICENIVFTKISTVNEDRDAGNGRRQSHSRQLGPASPSAEYVHVESPAISSLQ
jgi:hypothetical protein